jgi:hypothetical protein
MGGSIILVGGMRVAPGGATVTSGTYTSPQASASTPASRCNDGTAPGSGSLEGQSGMGVSSGQNPGPSRRRAPGLGSDRGGTERGR